MSNIVNIALTSGTRIAVTGATAVSAAAIAWMFGSEGLGVFALLRTLPSIINILTDMGIHHSYPYLVGNQKYRDVVVFSTTSRFILALSVFQILLWICMSPIIHEYLIRNIDIEFIVISCILSPLVLIQSQIMNMMRAINKIYEANYLRLVDEGAVILLILLTYILSVDNLGIVSVILVGAHTCTVGFGLYLLWKTNLLRNLAFDKALLRKALSFGIRRQIGGAFMMLNYRLDHIILAALAGTSTLGVYVVASKVAEFSHVLAGSVNFAIEPYITRISGTKAVMYVVRGFVPLIIVNLAIIGLAYLIGPTVITTVFDEWSIEAILPFNILLVGLAVSGGNGLLESYFAGIGRPGLISIPYGIALSVTVILDFALIPKYGVVGAAVASTCAYCAASVALGLMFLRVADRSKLKS